MDVTITHDIFCDPECQNNGTCVLGKCSCPQGFTGLSCEDISDDGYGNFSSLAAIIGGVSFIAIMVVLSCLAFVSLLKKPQDNEIYDRRAHDSRLVSVAAIDPCPSFVEEEVIAQSDIPPRYSQVTISVADRQKIAKTFRSIEQFKAQNDNTPPSYDLVEHCDESGKEEESDQLLICKEETKHSDKES
ncbi:uncharacterized protein LOC117100965 isoform X2 [Anneissia japonica]|nr:uncharacterized protein LOC117100965 isoform X2 [Anneissia japonica]